MEVGKVAEEVGDEEAILVKFDMEEATIGLQSGCSDDIKGGREEGLKSRMVEKRGRRIGWGEV